VDLELRMPQSFNLEEEGSISIGWGVDFDGAVEKSDGYGATYSPPSTQMTTKSYFMQYGVDQLILFPSSNYKAASLDRPAVWRTTRS